MKRHFCMSIKGALNNNRKNLVRIFKDDIFDDEGNVAKTANEIKNFFYDELAKGRRVLPLGDCDNFDYQKGCLGHSEEGDSEETLALYPDAK